MLRAERLGPSRPRLLPGERRRLEEAVRTVGAAIAARQRQTEKTIGKQQAAIFEAHVLILNDPEMAARV